MNTTAGLLIEWDGGWVTADDQAEAEALISKMLHDWEAAGSPGERSDFTVTANVPV